jgi:hypothetical protein
MMFIAPESSHGRIILLDSSGSSRAGVNVLLVCLEGSRDLNLL